MPATCPPCTGNCIQGRACPARASRTIWEVEIERKRTLNEYQNQRKRRLTFPGETAEAAMAEAERQYPEFKAVSARRAPL